MGNPSSIAVKYSSGETIYLYGHLLGTDNQTIVDEAIAEGRRLGDEVYFTRILFSKMIADDIRGELGFGISPYLIEGGHNPTVFVDFTDARWGVAPQVYTE